MGKEKELTNYKSDLLDDLKDPEYAALYLANVLDGGSSEEFLLALRDVAEAHKMSAVAQTSNLNRESLYKMLSESGNPRLNSLKAVLESVGLRLSVELRARETPVPAGGHSSDAGTQRVRGRKRSS